MSALLLWAALFGAQPDLITARLFAATSDGAFVSYSWGEHWVRLRPDLRGFTGGLSAFACLGPVVFAGGTDGVFVSDDFGETYGRVAGFEAKDVTVFLTARRFALEPTIFAGASTGLFRSKDGGAEWIPIGAGSMSSAVHALLWPGPELLAATEAGLFRSLDSGESWELVDGGLPRAAMLSIAISRYYGLDPTMFVGTRGAGIYRSTDGGEHFERVGGDEVPSSTVRALFWWGSLLLVGTDDGLFLSDDAGDTLGPIAELEGRAIFSILVPVPEVGAQSDVIVGTDEGVFKSSDGAVRFRRIAEGLGTPTVTQLATFPVPVQEPKRTR